MANWEVVQVTSDLDGNVSEAHWRHGNAYGSVDIVGTAADDFVLLVKTAFGAERVALIEAQEALRVAKQAAPETVTVAPNKLADAIKVKPEQAKVVAVAEAVAAVELADTAYAEKQDAEQVAKQAEMEAVRPDLNSPQK